MKNADMPQFGKVRSFFWPIYANEKRKIIPMLLIFFLICFSYSILRCMKDTVVVTASGAEVIPFIKFWALLPMAVLLTCVFTKLASRYSQEKVTYIMISGFLAFYTLFAFVLYPLRDSIHPHFLAATLEEVLPNGFHGLVAMLRYWSFTCFYVFAELWGSIVLSVLFWGFANEVTHVTEARRYYAVLSIGSNIAAMLAGQAANYLSMGGIFNPHFLFGKTAWEQTVMVLISLIVFCGIAVMIIFWWMNRYVLNDPSFKDLHESRFKLKQKKRFSIRESVRYLSNSKYLICIAILVVSYNLVINLVEVMWKDQLRNLYPFPNDYNTYMNNLTSMSGVISTILAFFMAWTISKFGWTKTALLTPLTVLITSIGFFGFLFFQKSCPSSFVLLLGGTPLTAVIWFGALQNCLSKAAKYSVFDTTKEMTFIPLEHDVKLSGKAAIDGVGSRLGKSGGALIYQGLLMFTGGLLAGAPYVAAIVLGVILLWIFAVRSLGRQFHELVKEEERKEAGIAAATGETEPVVSEPLTA